MVGSLEAFVRLRKNPRIATKRLSTLAPWYRPLNKLYKKSDPGPLRNLMDDFDLACALSRARRGFQR